ncbi:MULTISPECIES: serine/threonine protein kinase [Myxococcus]|uniref:Serine/threonine protein kinase n=1 Tax=Myxococcus xanthus TaxID=34 RepID=A0AAE6G3H5_MYXXA|nr:MULTISPECIES: serine/threonine-protein kinase [Myxococcus]QDE70092.1 serine/threonine protein kinase [Myxococcus xanthus]QDE77371.1 serine/threonine protein kinase [Myxococcus xanthus]QDE84758.1 serine/threonine protein kinase [Myxococcus xanthus]QDE98921.1 serine/threonine protein kinase [Myxococcus xanthus]QDF06586.1 serine/threonine protein kinase [Myxococcus xanthus]
MPPAAPQRDTGRFGKYRLIDRIAVGGMAEIFLAHQQQDDGRESPVVIKRIRPHLSKHAAFVKMFLNEARLASQLNHPNVVQIHDLGKIADSYFIAMDYVSGRDMRRVVPKAEALGIPFPLVYAVKIASCVCAGLHHAHTKVDLYGNPLNIVHRDVSPENIVVAFDGSVKILDFGIAKAANQMEQTRNGEIKGKLSYMSPEQCLGKPLDCRSDVFSLGVVLYEWLTGFKLFTGESEAAVMRSITDGKIYAPSYFREDLPERLEIILMRALERDRDKRYQTAAQMQKDLDAFLDAYDFTPTALHLSNFIKQLFEEELAAEQRRLAVRAAAAPTSEEALELSDVAAALDTAKAVPAPEPEPPARDDRTEPRTLAVPLSPAVSEALDAVARRNNVPAGRMVAELLESWLKYR